MVLKIREQVQPTPSHARKLVISQELGQNFEKDSQNSNDDSGKVPQQTEVIGLIWVRFEKSQRTPREFIPSKAAENIQRQCYKRRKQDCAIKTAEKYKKIKQASKEEIKKIPLYLYKCSFTTTLEGSLYMDILHMITKAHIRSLQKSDKVQMIRIRQGPKDLAYSCYVSIIISSI